MADLFVYGPLIDRDLMAAVAGCDPAAPMPAVLPDHTIYPLAVDDGPGLAAQAGGQVQGVIWPGLNAALLDRVRFYCAVQGGSLQDVTVMQDGMPRAVLTCFPDPAAQAGDGDWSLAAWRADHLAPALLAVVDIFALDPRPDAGAVRTFWHAVKARAWSHHRARHTGPATIRHRAQSDDVTVTPVGPPAGSFFRFQVSTITHRRFDGSRSGPLRREAFIGFDAVIVLPYDPQRDRVLVLEQARVGPMLRRDPNPWLLEAVAGIIDAGETAEQAAMRETAEEAGITLNRLLPAGSYYPSPGEVTDYFHNFVGLCDLPMTAAYSGGLDSEGEDLRLHPMDFDAAMALADSGEITTGPLLTLLYWLARHRDRVRGMG